MSWGDIADIAGVVDFLMIGKPETDLPLDHVTPVRARTQTIGKPMKERARIDFLLERHVFNVHAFPLGHTPHSLGCFENRRKISF
ncbi:MAG TPA: hypothetical protein VFV92_02595 [Candidatus Bathyarchaeia archaeon]|nr:hypothetical protein [Candidatus Bathyarchaeia archaeon]